MLNQKEEIPSPYRDDAMTSNTCLVCGETLGTYGYVYLGKSVCRSCIEYIRSKF